MKIRIAWLITMLSLGACAGMPEPETPAQETPSKRAPRREPLQKTPSDMPDVVYASAAPRLPTTYVTKL
ncbi:MAG TPA: hypothetical protein PK156_48295 [Polyangium sp.]|nr:hypothetical protein [Polyangium sp.]